jgi:Na+/proline symporter
MQLAIIIYMIVVTLYTIVGGMWSIAITDFVQTIIIVGGLIFLVVFMHTDVMPLGEVISQAPPGFFRITPKWNFLNILEWSAALITLGLGAIPSQDIFQRLLSSRSASVAKSSSIAGGIMYLIIGMLPLILALYGRVLYDLDSFDDLQLLLPTLVFDHAGNWLKIMFIGALLSAILSTASAAILAPATVVAENMIRPILGNQSDRKMLFWLRISVFMVAVTSLLMALRQGNVYELVAQASTINLVCLFVPLVTSLWIKGSSGLGVMLSMTLGFGAWIISEFVFPTAIPPQFVGLGASIAGMILGSLWTKKGSLFPG